MELEESFHYQENTNRTKEGLPKLTAETLNEFNKEFKKKIHDGEPLKPLLEEWSKEMESENPALLAQIQFFAGSYPPQFQDVTTMRFIILYQILKVQAIKDNLYFSEKIFDYYSRASGNKRE